MTAHRQPQPQPPSPPAQQFAYIRSLDRALSDVVTRFHNRARENCWDSLAGELLQYHRPHLSGSGPPECHGCDRRTRHARPPYWPCSTYTTIAATVLNLPSRTDVTTTLADLIAHLSHTGPTPRRTE